MSTRAKAPRRSLHDDITEMLRRFAADNTKPGMSPWGVPVDRLEWRTDENGVAHLCDKKTGHSYMMTNAKALEELRKDMTK